MKSILDEILESTRARVASARKAVDVAEMRVRALQKRSAVSSHAFLSAIQQPDRLNIIAEFKKASPSKGVINDVADPGATARSYEASGACAVSVLTEPAFFKGRLEDLAAIRNAVSLPILRKDFIVDEFQIYEAAEAGADAILLIVAALSTEQLRRFRSVAQDELGMDALIEVHDSEEMRIANEIDAKLVGVNNRNLRTFDVSLDVSRELVKIAPPAASLVSESGLKSRGELLELQSLGYSAFLIGETLMRAGGSGLSKEMLR